MLEPFLYNLIEGFLCFQFGKRRMPKKRRSTAAEIRDSAILIHDEDGQTTGFTVRTAYKIRLLERLAPNLTRAQICEVLFGPPYLYPYV